MKKIFLLILIVCLGKISFSQNSYKFISFKTSGYTSVGIGWHPPVGTTYPVTQYLGSTNTMVVSRGGLMAGQTFALPSYLDTTSANANGYTNGYVGSTIWATADSSIYVYQKSSFGNFWFKIGSSGAGPGGYSWNVGGNLFPTTPAGGFKFGTTSTYGGAITIITSGATRLIVPDAGILNSTASTDSVVVTKTDGFTLGKISKSALIGSAGWSLTGNDINPATNFIGTIDNSSFRIRTNDIPRMVVDSVGFVGIGTATPLAPLHVGAGINFALSNDPGILISRDISDATGTGSAHGFVDMPKIFRNEPGTGYGSFDSRPLYQGTSGYDHWASFQSIPIYRSTGTMQDVYGLFHALIADSGTVRNSYGAWLANPAGVGHIKYNYGVYVANMNRGDTSNYSIFAAGTSQSYFGGPVGIGDSSAASKLVVRTAANKAAFIGKMDDYFTGSNVTSGIGFSRNSDGVVVNGIYNINDAGGIPDLGLAARNDFNFYGGGTLVAAIKNDGSFRFNGALLPNNLPGTSGQVLTSAGTGVVPTWATPSTVATAVPISGLTAATATNSISNSTYRQTWNWNTLVDDIGLIVKSTSTAADNNAQTVMQVINTGVNANATQTTYALEVDNTHSGTGSTNVALNVTASSGTINNAINIGGGALTLSGSAGTSGQVLTSAGASTLPTWSTPSTVATAVPLSGITAATAANSIDNGLRRQTWNWTTLSSSSAFELNSTGTAAGNGQTLFVAGLAGVNAASSVTSYAMDISNDHSGTSSTNYGARFSATSGTNNYAIIVPSGGGSVGIGTSAPTTILHVAKNVTDYPTTGVYGQLELTTASTPTQRLSLGYNSSTLKAFIQSVINADSYTDILLNPSGGNVGVGVTTVPSMLTVGGLINMKNYTVATLPAGTRGDICYVTDALLPTFLATVAGGGAVITPVFFDGTNWKSF